jgi:hypothetical protein
MDGTGSMDGLILKAKNTVHKMFERSYEVLKSHKLADGCFELMFTIYRNYNSSESDLLESSGWETKPESIR